MIPRLSLALLCLLAASVSSIEIVSQSAEEVLVAEGGESHLTCESDGPMEYCKWTLPSGGKCTAADMNLKSCTEEPRFTIGMEETSCTLSLAEIGREDVGDYSCTLTHTESDPVSSSASINVQVAVQSQVHFSDEYTFVEPVPMAMDVGVTVECHARGGWPQPNIKVALGPEKDVISPDDRYLTIAEGATEVVENEDGTVDVANFFTLVPSMADCGKYVKCEAVQMDENGELLFDDGASVVSKKILVTFPPQPLNEPLGPITFTPGEEYVEVEVMFMANPVPLNHEAKWKITPSVDTGVDPVDVYAGNDFFEKYSAAPLNTTGHHVVAKLVIYNPDYADEDFAYALEVSNGEGEAYYEFSLTTRALLITTMAPMEGAPPAEQSGVSGGTIAAIVIVIILVIVGLIIVFWAKKNHKWCFAQYDAVKAKNDLEAAQMQQQQREVEEAPIVKTEARAPNNAVNSEPPQSDLEKPDDSDSEERARRSSSVAGEEPK